MRYLRYWVLIVIAIVAAACYEVNEEIAIGKDGSGTYVTKMDMSALVQMMQSMASADELAKNGLDRVIDTSIAMKDLLDSAKDATPEQKRLLGPGTMKLQMNMAENIFKADVQFPFKNIDDLGKLMSGAGTGGMGDVLKNVFAQREGASAPMQESSLEGINNIFDVKATRNSITKQLNRARYDSLMVRPELAQVKQLTGAGMEVLYTTTIRLPRPVKKFDNEMIKLSEDKKTVTIKYDLLKIFETPEKFSYALEY